MPIKHEMLVRRDALDQVAINETIAPVPGAGEVLLEVEAFALTANTVTYAVVGETVGYWRFFPAAEGWGVVPAWGYARVTESRCDGLAPGERVYGLMPMASHLLVAPGRITAELFRDVAPHRQTMSPVYNQYHRLGAGPARADGVVAGAAVEDLRMLFEPLFLTAFLIADSLRRAAMHGADTVVLTSASSKTALASAYALRALSPGVRRIGLTSAGNVGFVAGTGLYDQVLAYDALAPLDDVGAAVVIDLAGDAALLRALYAGLPGRLAHCLRVGVTHHAAAGDTGMLAGPKPVWFFAPDAATTLIGEIGQQGFNAAVAAQWAGFVALAAGLVTVEHHAGMKPLQRLWHAQLSGQARPDTGHVVRP